MKFKKKNEYGIIVYSSESASDYRVEVINGSCSVFVKDRGQWKFINQNFRDIKSCEIFVQDESSRIENSDVNMLKKMYGFDETWDNMHSVRTLYTDRKSKDGDMYQLRIVIDGGYVKYIETFKNYDSISNISERCSKDELVEHIDWFINYSGTDLFEYILCAKEHRSSILCASSRDLSKNIVRVKSSNVWGYYLDIKNRKDKTGDLIVQFKNKNGGPGDVYLYFDVPVMLYRKWHSATSVGHFFWQYIRNDFKYRKLTGDKRGKLRNAVNN